MTSKDRDNIALFVKFAREANRDMVYFRARKRGGIYESRALWFAANSRRHAYMLSARMTRGGLSTKDKNEIARLAKAQEVVSSELVRDAA